MKDALAGVDHEARDDVQLVCGCSPCYWQNHGCVGEFRRISLSD